MATTSWGACLLALVSAAAGLGAAPVSAAPLSDEQRALLDRLTWGVNATDAKAITTLGTQQWIDRQLHPHGDRLPSEIQAQIDAMPVGQPALDTVRRLDAVNKAAEALPDPDQRAAAKKQYQEMLNQLGHQAAKRSILRDLYSPNQLQEQLTWFWFNHFNVHIAKANGRAVIGDYEEKAIRAHALGRFRDLLAATLRHPAMLRYLDNANNANGHINENYAREIMELHTMGVGSGYTQKDVQELARILTGVGIDASPENPKLRPELASQLVRDGLFEFNPGRHDYGDKQFLGHTIKGRGLGEVDEALDILAAQPATAHYVCLALARSFVGDTPPESLVRQMSAVFLATHGDIAAVMASMIAAPAFKASLGSKFKDPVHYVLSAVRLAYDGRTVVNTQPIDAWLNRLAQGLYNHQTPDGYPATAAYWNGPGQLTVRFEIARQIAGGAVGLFRPEGAPPPSPGTPQPPAAVPDLRQMVDLLPPLGPATRSALAQAASNADANTLILSSPEFMRR